VLRELSEKKREGEMKDSNLGDSEGGGDAKRAGTRINIQHYRAKGEYPLEPQGHHQTIKVMTRRGRWGGLIYRRPTGGPEKAGDSRALIRASKNIVITDHRSSWDLEKG